MTIDIATLQAPATGPDGQRLFTCPPWCNDAPPHPDHAGDRRTLADVIHYGPTAGFTLAEWPGPGYGYRWPSLEVTIDLAARSLADGTPGPAYLVCSPDELGERFEIHDPERVVRLIAAYTRTAATLHEMRAIMTGSSGK
ncbi:hypothetical protein P3T27_007496 [Kitasatospora sp. MAA19]|uniref:DUF6907 domain-containing protein n=1 Tax=unclassified Kitasatospora TaxID=2633591 RepID=UPI002475BB4C|nr:hypothetical protein [Kitasatospora sp. MAA19]MDH6710745.1 hypothetical protein [Kitasatospora sp. MAA19]